MALDIQVIPKAVQESIVETFKMMAQDKAEIGALVNDDPTFANDPGIVSLLSAKSDQFSGSFALYFPASTYIPLMNKILGENQTSICDGNADGASEFLNIIYSTARTKINETGFNFQPSIPATLKGQLLEMPKPAGAKVVKLNGKCGFGPFTLVISLAAK